jgi:MFS transporter, putative metabolite:H+ symporter
MEDRMVAMKQIDSQTKLTRNQKIMVTVIITAACLEFFDYFIIAFVLAFITKPWQLTFGNSAAILLSAGVGSIIGAFIWGTIADKIGRRPTFIATILTFSVASLLLAFTPEGSWLYICGFRFIVGFGVGGFVVDMPYVQEFLPSRIRGFVSSLVSVFVPIGLLIGSLLGAYLVPLIGWRGMFVVGAVPAVLTLLIRSTIPESPVWALRRGRVDEARASIAWALMCRPDEVDLGPISHTAWERPRFAELLRYPRSLVATWLGNIGAVTGEYGLILWGPTLLVLVLNTTPAHASTLFIGVSLVGVAGRLAFGYMSDRIGRRWCGGIFGLVSAILLPLTAMTTQMTIGDVSLFWIMLMVTFFFADGGFSINGPYSAELWPSRLRATGMGAAYGFGSIGKIIGPLGLAMIVGSSDFIAPAAMLPAVMPAFLYLAGWYALAGIAYGFVAIETKGLSFDQIDAKLEAGTIRHRVPEVSQA